MGTFTVRCWGCDNSETHSWNGPGPEHDTMVEEMKSRGWMRRSIYKSDWDQGPWFCSDECAYYSYNAVQAEQYWRDEEFKEYCQQTKIPLYMWLPLIFAGLLAFGSILGECFHAGLQ